MRWPCGHLLPLAPTVRTSHIWRHVDRHL